VVCCECGDEPSGSGATELVSWCLRDVVAQKGITCCQLINDVTPEETFFLTHQLVAAPSTPYFVARNALTLRLSQKASSFSV
jgi:hypothetical protein